MYEVCRYRVLCTYYYYYYYYFGHDRSQRLTEEFTSSSVGGLRAESILVTVVDSSGGPGFGLIPKVWLIWRLGFQGIIIIINDRVSYRSYVLLLDAKHVQLFMSHGCSE